MGNIFKKDFVDKLKTTISPEILELDLEFPERQIGGIRFDDEKLTAVYFNTITANTTNEINPLGNELPGIVLKFQYREFQHIDEKYSFVCTDVYVQRSKDGLEYRYDANLNLNAKYKKTIDPDTHFNKLVQFEKDGEEVDNSYTLHTTKCEYPFSKDFKCELFNVMSEDFNFEDIQYFRKNNTIYLYLLG